MRIVFMGSPAFSVPTLEALHDAHEHEVVTVYAQPPRKAGRGQKQTRNPVHQTADTLGLPVYTPVNFKDSADQATFVGHDADLAVVVAYGLLLPEVILNAPRLGCINIHASLLPRWRGAAPIHRAILSGDTQTGICLMQMDKGLDTGPVYTRHTTDITDEDTVVTLHDRLSDMGARALLELLVNLENATATPQSADGVTYADKITKDEARIDWSQPAEAVLRQIRAMTLFPGAWTMLDGQRLKILEARVDEASTQHMPGMVVDEAFGIACGGGTVLRPVRVQLAGKSAMLTDAFLRGSASIVPGQTQLSA